MNLTDQQMLSMVRELIQESVPTQEQRAQGAQALRAAAALHDSQVTILSVEKIRPEDSPFLLSRGGGMPPQKRETERSTMQQAALHKQNEDDDETHHTR